MDTETSTTAHVLMQPCAVLQPDGAFPKVCIVLVLRRMPLRFLAVMEILETAPVCRIMRPASVAPFGGGAVLGPNSASIHLIERRPLFHYLSHLFQLHPPHQPLLYHTIISSEGHIILENNITFSFNQLQNRNVVVEMERSEMAIVLIRNSNVSLMDTVASATIKLIVLNSDNRLLPFHLHA